MNKIDYNLAMEQTIGAASPGAPLFLHACCAPCSSTALERLGGHFSITLYYYNPNIWPKAEYEKRLDAFLPLLRHASTRYPVKLEAGPYDDALFEQLAAPLAAAPEGGARCEVCFALRLERTAKTAKNVGFPLFGTTLTVGPRKNAALVNATGVAAAEKHGLSWLPADLKKKDGYRRSVLLSAEYGLYRQHSCGCRYSLPQNPPANGTP